MLSYQELLAFKKDFLEKIENVINDKQIIVDSLSNLDK